MFVSISVDPKRDTRKRSKEYSERMGASWPHLTGTQEELQPVWDAFALVVQENVIDVHVAEYQPGEASVTVVDTNNDSSQHMFAWSMDGNEKPTGEAAGWTFNTSVSEWGRMLHGINGVDSPSDWSWYWELNVERNEHSMEASSVGMDDLDATAHLTLLGCRPTATGPRSQPNAASHASSTTVMWPNKPLLNIRDVQRLSPDRRGLGSSGH